MYEAIRQAIMKRFDHLIFCLIATLLACQPVSIDSLR
jgi:hypothetical protein